MIEHDFLDLLVYLLGLSQYDVPFSFHRGGLELGVLENIGEDVHSLVDVGVEGFGVVDRVLSAGVGIEMTALGLCEHVDSHIRWD